MIFETFIYFSKKSYISLSGNLEKFKRISWNLINFRCKFYLFQSFIVIIIIITILFIWESKTGCPEQNNVCFEIYLKHYYYLSIYTCIWELIKVCPYKLELYVKYTNAFCLLINQVTIKCVQPSTRKFLNAFFFFFCSITHFSGLNIWRQISY